MKKLLSLLLILSLALVAITSCGTDGQDNLESGSNESESNESESNESESNESESNESESNESESNESESNESESNESESNESESNESGDVEDVTPESHVHQYNRQKPAAAFEKTAATCISAGVYYYSCACGEYSTDTFTDTALSPCKYEAGICIWCGTAEPSETDGLVYAPLKNGEAFMVTGYNGTAREVYIPSYHEGKPVLRVSSRAFNENATITSVIIGDNVFAIDSNAFADCTNLEHVVLGSGVETIGERAFGWCQNLKSVNLPDSLTVIENDAFWMCSGLTEIRIPYGVTTIGEQAFGRCDGLTDINIPDSVESISRKAFYWCINLKQINVDVDNAAYASKDGVLYNKDMTVLLQYPIGRTNADFAIPETVTTIGYFAFSCSANLKNLTVPDSINKIEYYAFGEVSGLNYNKNNGLLYLGNESNPYLYLAGVESKSITSAIVDSECRFIGDLAFSFCTSLIEVSFGADSRLVSVGNNAFFYCDLLESVAFPASVKQLNSPFYACISLNAVTFEDNANWYVTNNHDVYVNPVGGVVVSTTDSTMNATYFSETYLSHCWYKK